MFFTYVSFLVLSKLLRMPIFITLLSIMMVYHMTFTKLNWGLTCEESLLHMHNLGSLISFLVLISGSAGFLSHSLFLKLQDYFIMKLFSLLLLFMFLASLSVNLMMFYLVFEASLWPILFLILGWGYQPERLKAGLWMALYTLIASLPLLILMLVLFFNADLSMMSSWSMIMQSSWSGMLLICLTLAFLVKFPIFLVHLWLPKAHVEAPVVGSMFLAAILLKLGGLGIYYVSSLFMKNSFSLMMLLLILSGGALISILCTWQKDAKVLIAYSSVSHMALASALLISSPSKEGLLASTGIMLSHGISSSFMFCLANSLYKRSQTRLFTLQKNFLNILPMLMFMLFFAVISNMAAPPTFNFFVEIMASVLLFSYSKLFALFVGAMIFFSASYSVVIYLSLSQGSRTLNKSILMNVSSREFAVYSFHVWSMFWFLFLL